MSKPRFQMLPHADVEVERWNRAAERYPEAWLWHRREAMDAYATWDGANDLGFALLDMHANELAAIVPLHGFAGRWPGRRLLRRLQSNGGPAYSPDLSERLRRLAERSVRDSLYEIARAEGAQRIDLSLAPLTPALRDQDAPRVNPLAMLGCADASTQSWVLDLSGTGNDDLWDGLEQRVRKAVRRADRAGYSVRAARPDDFEEFLRLHRQTVARNRLPVRADAYFDLIFRTFLPAGMATGFCARREHTGLAAIHIFATWKGGALYWIAASDAEALTHGVNDLVQWHAIEWLASQGFEHYDAGEAFPGQVDGKLRRISDFKKGFGGDLVPYYRGTLITRPFIAAVHGLLRAIR